MSDPAARLRPTYSARLFRAFAEVLRDQGQLDEVVQQLEGFAGERILMEVAHQGLSMVVAFTGDEDLGLKAARRLVLGDVGTVDYVVGSAPTVRDAVERASRYLRLVNEALDVRLELDGQVAIVKLDNSIVLPRAAADFEVAGFFRNHVHAWFEKELSSVAVWFTHQTPIDTAEYERTFAPATVRFNAPCLGFTFDRRLLDLPLPTANSNLERVVVPYADLTLEQLSLAKTLTAEIRTIVEAELPSGGPDIADVAARLGMSMRTLARRLESEGTSFRDVIDDVRRRLALASVGQQDVAFSDIAQRLGFSHGAAFHRAFRRWTGQTPLNYRRSHGR